MGTVALAVNDNESAGVRVVCCPICKGAHVFRFLSDADTYVCGDQRVELAVEAELELEGE